jgi:anti-anti-sigma regulatory factor
MLNAAQALRLLGCAVTLSGISAEVAMTVVGLACRPGEPGHGTQPA